MSEIVPTLFGLSPEAFQQQRQDRVDERALALAQLDPFQRASFNIQRGADRLAGVVGGMLGGQDPELERRTQAQQIFGTIDPSDPDTFLRAAEMALQGGDQQLAFGLRNEHAQRIAASQKAAQDALESDAKIFKDLQGPSPTGDVAKGIRVGEISKLLENPDLNASDRNALEAELSILDPEKKPIPKITTVGVAVNTKKPVYLDANTNEQFTFGAGPDGTQVRMPYMGAVDRTTARTDVKLDNQLSQAPNVVKAIAEFDKLVGPAMTAMQTAQNVQTLLNQALIDNNSQAFQASRTTLAKLIGENKLSNEDIRNTGIDPRLIQGLLDFINKKTVGVPNEDVMKQMFAVAKALELKAVKKINTQADRAQVAAKASGFPGNPNLYFPRATPAGEEDTPAAKEARYQVYKQDREKRAQEGR